MLITKNKLGKRVLRFLMTFRAFNRNFVVLEWDEYYLVRRTKPFAELIKNKITEENILKLKYKYHRSHDVLKEYVAEIHKHIYDDKKLVLNIWTTEEKIDFIKKTEILLTEETNMLLKELLDKKVFKEKYGDEYIYFISLHLDREITKIGEDERQCSQLTLKYSLKTAGNEKRLKSKINISKNEAKKICSAMSYWKK